MGWIIVTYRLPAEPSRARVAVWRQIRRTGALHLQQSVVVLPDTEAFRPALDELHAVITRVGGEVLAVRGDPLDEPSADRLRGAWNEARDDEYRELAGECAKFLAEIDHEFAIEKFTPAELEEEEAEVDKLERWHAAIRARDLHGAEVAAEAEAAMERAREALARYAEAVYERTMP